MTPRLDPPAGPPRPALPPRRVPAWGVNVLAAIAVIGVALAPIPIAGLRPNGPLALLIVLLPALLLPFRRRWPLPTLAGAVILYGLAAWQQTLSPGAGLTAGIALFTVADLGRSRRTTIAAAAVSAAIMVALSLYATRDSGFDPRVFQTAVSMAFVAAAGDAVRSRREYVRAITERAERAEQTRETEARRRVTEERLRIARDLHDAVAHQISVISLNAGVASETLESHPDKARNALGVIRTASRTVLHEISDLLQLLRTDDDQNDDRAAGRMAPPPGLARMDELISRFSDTGLQVSVRTSGDLRTMTGAADLVAYRVIQEGLTNADKHGSERRAHVLVDVSDQQARITITNPVDPGIAAPTTSSAASVPSVSSAGGFGLLGLRERVASVRGSVETGTTYGSYHLTAVLPLSPQTQPRPTQETP